MNPLWTWVVLFLLPACFLLPARRAFITWESLFRPAGVIPPFFLAVVVRPIFSPAFSLAQRALAAAASLARVAADILRLSLVDVVRAGAPPRTDARRLSKWSICRPIGTASSKVL